MARVASFGLIADAGDPFMAGSTITIRANFETREAADLAVEHLVKQLGISRPDVFIRSVELENTTGSKA
jgi:hypothetical protein